MTLDLRALQYFMTINQCGGFAKAARQLKISQPTLSRGIAALEQEMGAHLFDRSTKGTSITPAGLRLLPHAATIIDEVERAQALFEAPETESFTQIRIGLSPNLLEHLGDEAIHTVIRENRNVHVAIQTGTMETLIDKVKAGEIAFAVCLIVTNLLQNLSKYEGCSFEEIGTDAIYPIARQDHPVFNKPATLENLANHDWAVPHELSVSYRFESVFFRRNLPLPKERLNTNSMPLMKTAIKDWAMIGMMPPSLIFDDLKNGNLKKIENTNLDFYYSVAIIKPSKMDLSHNILTAIATFRDIISQKLARPPEYES